MGGWGEGAALWPHQVEAIELACKELAGGGRASVVMACGTGKTRVAAHACARLAPAGRRLVLAPTVMLQAQLIAEFRRALGGRVVGRVLAVCQDAAGAGSWDRRATAGLGGDVRVTTDPEVIAGVAAGPGPVTVVSTYASAVALSRAHAEHGLGGWDVIVLDEAHRTVSGPAWSKIHDDAYLPAARRLYMTATPRTLAGRATAAELVGMDDEGVYGPVVYRMGYPTAVELGLLARYRLVVAIVSDAEIRALTDQTRGRTGVRVGDAVIPARMLAAQIAVLRAAARYGVGRVISYHAGVDEARHFAATLPRVADLMPTGQRPAHVQAEHLRAEHCAFTRRTRLERLATGVRDGVAVVSNARLLSEGIDVPAVDGVVFADPRHSSVDIIQAIGRAMRLGDRPGKTATIIVPLLCEAATDPALALESSDYAPVWRVVRALRSHDDDLAAELDAARRSHGTGEGIRAPRWFHVDGLEVPGVFAQAITVRMVEAATASWDQFYGAARAYANEHGDLDVPQAWVSGTGLCLGRWLHDQRTRYKRGLLRPERARLLEAIGMVWSPLQAAWEAGYHAAAAYQARHGHLNVHREHVDEAGYKLGQWIGVQRARYRKRSITAEQITRLEDLGMVWNIAQARREANWNRACAAAAAFRAEHGHLNVPQGHVTADGVRLGAWIINQRSRQHQLTPQRRAELTGLGMVWADRKERAFERGYAALAAFGAEHGHLNVPATYTTATGFNLGAWVASTRHRRPSLSEEQHRRLNDLGMVWSARQAAWDTGLAHATAYATEHGHLHPPSTHVTPDGFRLGAWLANRRTPGRITPEQRAQLDTLDPTWADPPDRTRPRKHAHAPGETRRPP